VGRVGSGPSRRTSAWDGAAIWVGMLSVTPCAAGSASGALAASSTISASRCLSVRLSDHSGLGCQAVDAERVERQLELACGTVIDHGLEEQVQNAEAFGDKEQFPDRIEERGGAASSSRNPLSEGLLYLRFRTTMRLIKKCFVPTLMPRLSFRKGRR
jgi:hypothetical protein